MTTPNHTPERSSEDWAPCAPGTLCGLGQRLRSEKRHHLQTGAVGAALVATAALLVVAYWPSGQAVAVPPQRINCRECRDLMPAFFHKVVDEEEMPEEQSEAVKKHLDRCGGCRKRFEKDHPGVLSIVAAGLTVMLPSAGLLSSVWRRSRCG